MAKNTTATREELLLRLDAKTVPEPNTGCLLWTGSYDKNGYGKTHHNKKHIRAHRLAFELKHGPIPEGKLVQHSCDTPACCNSDHLSLGTPLSNMQDKMKKGRFRNQYINASHCIRGHEFSSLNTRHKRGGERICVICSRLRNNSSYIRVNKK